MVVNKTPFALLSCFFFIKIKKTKRFGIAANDNTFPYNLPSLIISNVSLNSYLEKYSKYKNIPPQVANKEIKTPIRISFFIVPKNLIFESYDEQSYQIAQEPLKHIHFLKHKYLCLDLYLY